MTGAAHFTTDASDAAIDQRVNTRGLRLDREAVAESGKNVAHGVRSCERIVAGNARLSFDGTFLQHGLLKAEVNYGDDMG